MPDIKVSALTAVVTPDLDDEFLVNQGGVSKKMTLFQIHSRPYALGTMTIPTGMGRVQIMSLQLVTTDRLTIEGTGRLSLIT